MSENPSRSHPYGNSPEFQQEALFPIEMLQVVQPAEEYKLLVGHNRTDGSFKTDEQLRAQYMELTDKLVYKMTNGIEVEDPHTGEHEQRVPDVVVWLDKSARPLAWLTKEVWPQLAADADGNIPKMPEFRFVNIDREQWINAVDPNGSGVMNIDNVDPSVIRSLRSIYVSNREKEQGLEENIDNAESLLDGKTVMIVDEVYSTGRTLDIATKFYKRAFPDAYVGGVHWMGGITMKKGGAVGNADIPVWYNDKEAVGRGVLSRNEVKSEKSASLTQRMGRFFLSTALPGDEKSLQLRKEMKMLAHDAAEHKFVFNPSIERTEDDIDERVERYNGMPFKEVVAHKRAQDAKRR